MRLGRKADAEMGSASSVAVKRQKTLAAEAEPKEELVGRRIAGPETAARLGVPVGTVLSAFHVAHYRDGTSFEREITDNEAQEIRRSWGWEN